MEENKLFNDTKLLFENRADLKNSFIDFITNNFIEEISVCCKIGRTINNFKLCNCTFEYDSDEDVIIDYNSDCEWDLSIYDECKIYSEEGEIEICFKDNIGENELLFYV